MLPHPSEHSSRFTHLACTKGLLKPDSVCVSQRPHKSPPTKQRPLVFPFERMCFEKWRNITRLPHRLGVGWNSNPSSLTPELHFPSPQPVYDQAHWNWSRCLFGVSTQDGVLDAWLLCYRVCPQEIHTGPLQPLASGHLTTLTRQKTFLLTKDQGSFQKAWFQIPLLNCNEWSKGSNTSCPRMWFCQSWINIATTKEITSQSPFHLQSLLQVCLFPFWDNCLPSATPAYNTSSSVRLLLP